MTDCRYEFIHQLVLQTYWKKLSKTDLEGPSFKVVRLFHDNGISLQFQMEECHLLLTNLVDLVNPEDHRVVLDVSKPLPLRGPLVLLIESLTGGLSVKNSISQDTVPPLIAVKSDLICGFSVKSVSRLLKDTDQERYEHVGPQDTRPQDGERSQDDDQRLDLADDLKKAQDHISSTNTSHKTKSTTSMYKISHEESKDQIRHMGSHIKMVFQIEPF
ncbi:hypothetical protein Tco_1024121 [Tanacetum coccineum]